MGEGRHEDPQGGGVEQPVGRGPAHRPGQQGLVVHEDREPPGQPLDQRREAVGVEEADVGGHRMDDAAGPLLSPGQQIEEPAEGAEQDHPDGRGHHQQDGRGGRSVAVHAGRPEPVGGQEGDQRTPEESVEHDGGADPLRAEGEAGVRTRHAGLGQQSVAEGRPRGGPTRADVAEGQGRQVDPEDPAPRRAAVRQDRVRELGVGHECGQLEQHADGQVGRVDVGQGADLAAVAGQQRDRHVEQEEEDEDGADAQADFAPHERPAVPPPTVPARARPPPFRPVCRVGLHRQHVDTQERPDLPC